MQDIARRLFRYQRLLSPDAHNVLADTPGLIDRLEGALEDGVDLPQIIESSHLDDFISKKMSDKLDKPAVKVSPETKKETDYVP